MTGVEGGWRLFYCPPTCTIAAMAALELAELPYEAVEVDLAGGREELRTVSPLGTVPALQANGSALTDTLAIIHFADGMAPQAGLLPTELMARSQALSLMAWLGSTLHIRRRHYARPALVAEGEEAQSAIRDVAAVSYRAGLARLEGLAEARGAAWTLGVQAYAMLFRHWAAMDGIDDVPFAALDRLVADLARHPGVQRALRRHNSPLLMAAVGTA